MARVLVIDDDDQVRVLALEVLEAEGYQADSAADGTAPDAFCATS